MYCTHKKWVSDVNFTNAFVHSFSHFQSPVSTVRSCSFPLYISLVHDGLRSALPASASNITYPGQSHLIPIIPDLKFRCVSQVIIIRIRIRTVNNLHQIIAQTDDPGIGMIARRIHMRNRQIILLTRGHETVDYGWIGAICRESCGGDRYGSALDSAAGNVCERRGGAGVSDVECDGCGCGLWRVGVEEAADGEGAIVGGLARRKLGLRPGKGRDD